MTDVAPDAFDDRLIEAAALSPEDREFDVALRPRSLADFVGQDRVKQQLSVLLDGARQRGEPVDHLLFSGPPGLGKTTLAQIVALEMGAGFQPTSGPALERPSRPGRDPHEPRARATCCSSTRSTGCRGPSRRCCTRRSRTSRLDVVLGKGPTARSIRLDLPRFTLVAATTRPGRITLPLRERFGFSPRLDYYGTDDLAAIVLRSAGILGVATEPAGAAEIARRSRGTPRIANRLLRRVRDVAQVRHEGAITGRDRARGARDVRGGRAGAGPARPRGPARGRRRSSRGARSACRRWPRRWGRSPTRSRTSSSRTCSSWGSSSARRGGEPPPPVPTNTWA